MPQTKTETDRHGSPVFEYNGQVDFRVVTDWQVLSFLPEGAMMRFAKEMNTVRLSDLFDIRSRGMASTPKQSVTFAPLFMSAVKSDDARRKLLSLLSRLKMPMIWKEGKFGYDISRSGRIYRKWRLNTVYRT